MTSHLIFISLLLGLVSGKEPVDLQADDTVKSIRIVLAGEEIARLTQPPWHAEIDLGPALLPRKLEAIGYDASGNEIGRASQLLNLPHPRAEVEIGFENAGGFPKAVQLHSRSLDYAKPTTAKVTLDNVPLTVTSDFRADLPKSDWTHPHVLAAEVKFSDRASARREVVLGGATFSDVASAELTPVLLTETTAQHPPSYDACFSVDGTPVLAAAVEKPQAIAIFVRDPDAREAINAIIPRTGAEVSSWVRLDRDTKQKILWPIAQQYSDASRRELALLFRPTEELDAGGGLMRLLGRDGPFGSDNPRRYADAVAVAGVNAMSDGRRRAVVFLVSRKYPDASRDLNPLTVRRYLESIGVPLFVWSVTGPRPDLADSWGEVEDVSSFSRLRSAVALVRSTFEAQRIAWIRTDALSALRVKADERCGFATVAH